MQNSESQLKKTRENYVYTLQYTLYSIHCTADFTWYLSWYASYSDILLESPGRKKAWWFPI